MTITNRQSGTNVHEVADGIYRINTPVKIEGAGGFSFNQYLIVDDEPLLFHTGLRKMFPLVREAVASVLPVERLRYIAFSHVEADECGSLNEWLAAAPQSVPLCGTCGGHGVDRRPCRSGAPGARRWRAAPSGQALRALVRHAASAARVGMWLSDRRTNLDAAVWRPVHAGRLRSPAITESDILGPSEAFRHRMDYFSHTKNARVMLERLAATNPATLACMHGSAWRGDGAKLLRALADALSV